MQIKVKVVGIEQAQARLAAQQKKIDPVLRGALNTTATKSRAERYVKPLAKTIAPKRTRAAMKIKRARRGMMNSRVIPSGASVPAIDYKITDNTDNTDNSKLYITVLPDVAVSQAPIANPDYAITQQGEHSRISSQWKFTFMFEFTTLLFIQEY